MSATNVSPFDAELRKACFDLALEIRWVREPIVSDEIHKAADVFATEAKSYISEELEIDLPLIARAVRYIQTVHAIPMDVDARWFNDVLGTVLEIARPNSGIEERDKKFLKEMLRGIHSLLDDAAS